MRKTRHAEAVRLNAEGPLATVTALTRQGLASFKSGQFQDAAGFFEAALTIDPDQPICLNNLSLALVSLDQFEGAAAHLRRSLDLDPGQSVTWTSLAGLELRLDHHEAAKSASGAALALDNGNVTAWRIRFLACSRLLDFTGAAEALEMEIGLDGPSAELCSNLGAVLMHCGDFERAAPWLSQALVFDPSAAPTLEALNICRLVLLAASRGIGKTGSAFLEGLDLPTPKVEVVLRTAMLLLDAAGQQAACIPLARAWLAWRPTSLEAQHLLDAALFKSVERQPAQFVADRFDDLAARFDEHLLGQLAYAGPRQLQAMLGHRLSPQHPLDILDLGCGTGLCGAVLKPYARRLEGVDLSPNMLEKARSLGIYDKLDIGDLMDALEDQAAWDVIVVFDTLPYLGDSGALFSAVATALRPGGLFAFSTEAVDGDAYRLRGNGRFAHGADYIRNLAAGRFEILVDEISILRREAADMVLGGYFLLRSIDSTALP